MSTQCQECLKDKSDVCYEHRHAAFRDVATKLLEAVELIAFKAIGGD
jgi:hypothetical protein